MKLILAFFTILFGASFANAQAVFTGYEHLFTIPLSYKIYQTKDALKMDGILNESSWKAATWSAPFVDIEGDKKPLPRYNTRFKMLWDKHNLYIAAELEEPHIWSYLSQRDTIVYHDNDFEVFIDPDGDSHNYFEIEVNALKNVFDLFMKRPYRNGGRASFNWNVENLAVGVHIDGTLNRPIDRDKKWVVEMEIPFKSLSLGDTSQVPVHNSVWRLNFSRVEWDTEIINNRYVKKKDAKTGKPLPEHNWVWSPQGVINMHYPERWGYVQFIENPPAKVVSSFHVPVSEEVKKLLWLTYYKQQHFHAFKKSFARSLNELAISNDEYKIGNGRYLLALESTAHAFEATIKDKETGKGWRINHDGLLSNIKVN